MVIFSAMKRAKPITYAQVGDNYETKDPIKKLAQLAAKRTSKNLTKHGFEEISQTRGESAFVWKQDGFLMASVIEGLGTKNLIADTMYKMFPQKTYYDVIGHDTVATIINDLISVGAKPLVIHAYWAIEDNSWLEDKKRMADFIHGWEGACNQAGVTWGGGETPTLKGIIKENAVDLGGSAVGIIQNPKDLITDKKLKEEDRILLIHSNGVNANGVSLARAVAKKLPKGYSTKISTYKTYGEALLTQTNIYAKLIQDLQKAGVDIHYISNITGHGLRKIMRANRKFTYIVEKIFEPQEVFLFIQKHAGLSDYQMYETFNMGQDYAIFLPEKDVKKAQEIIQNNGFEGLDAGFLEEGKRKVVIKEKNIIFEGKTLDLR